MAEWTGLEPATSGVTGQHSNQLNYHSALLNLGEPAKKANLTALRTLVGAEGFEPPTLAL